MDDISNLGEYGLFVWLAYAVAGTVMFWLLWSSVKDLHKAEAAYNRLQNIPGASLASHYKQMPLSEPGVKTN